MSTVDRTAAELGITHRTYREGHVYNGAMTYLQFHLIAILPPLLVMAFLARPTVRAIGRRAIWAPLLIAAIAVIYTTPWDNYLVASGVWWYGPHRVLGTIGYVPIEEYAFFVLQSLLTSSVYFIFLGRFGSSGQPPETPSSRFRARIPGVVFWLFVSAAGAVSLSRAEGTYLGLILVWAGPMIAFLWLYGGDRIQRCWRAAAATVASCTLYLSAADRMAIGLDIWMISPEHTFGIHLLGLPLEEAVFFLLTNVLVVSGLTVMLQPRLGDGPETVAVGALSTREPVPHESSGA